MPRLINSQETKVPILPHFTVFFSVDDERCVISSAEFCAVGVVDGEGDGLPAEPVANVVGIAVVEGDTDGVVEDHFEVGKEIRIREVAGLLEGVVDVVVGLSIVEVHAEGILDERLVEVLFEIGRRRGVYVWVADAGTFVSGS